jgi:hypothetical protein
MYENGAQLELGLCSGKTNLYAKWAKEVPCTEYHSAIPFSWKDS